MGTFQRKLFKIDDHLGIGVSGLISDGRNLCRFMRNECLSHRYSSIACWRHNLKWLMRPSDHLHHMMVELRVPACGCHRTLLACMLPVRTYGSVSTSQAV